MASGCGFQTVEKMTIPPEIKKCARRRTFVGGPGLARTGLAYAINGTISKATMLMILISGLMAGPAVSL